MQPTHAFDCISLKRGEEITFSFTPLTILYSTRHPHKWRRRRPCVISTILGPDWSRRAVQNINHKSARSELSAPVIRAVWRRVRTNENGPAFAGPSGPATQMESGLRGLPSGVPGVLDPRQRHDEERRQEHAQQRIDPDERHVKGAHADAGNHGPKGSAVGCFHGVVRS